MPLDFGQQCPIFKLFHSAELADKIAFRDDGEAVLKGSDVEVYQIAALLAGGLSVDQVLADYPSLSRDAVEAAQAYAEAHPKPGRPYPRTTAKRALQGAGLEALDEVHGDGAASAGARRPGQHGSAGVQSIAS